MDQDAIIADICDQADDFLADARSREEAKTGITEWLVINHLILPPADRKIIVAKALQTLDAEGFFEPGPGSKG